MGKRRGAKRHARDNAGSPEDTTESQPSRRWLMATAIVVCVAVGAIVLERLSRPSDQPAEPIAREPGEQDDASAAMQRAIAKASSSLPQTADELKAASFQAVERLQKDLPQGTEGLALMGRVCLRFGNSAKALECWEECLRRNPDSAEACSLIGSLAWEQGDFSKAVACLEKAVAANPNAANLCVILGESLMNLGRTQEAVTVLEKTAKATPPPTGGLLALGQAYTQLKQYEKAKACYEAILNTDPRLKNAHYGLSVVLQRLGQPEKAMEHRQTFLTLKSQEWEVENRARAGPPTVNLAELRATVAGFLFSAGNIYHAQGHVDQAQQQWLKAAALDPENAAYRAILTRFYAQRL